VEPLRFSQLKNMAECPAFYRHALTAPEKKKVSFEKGTALHSYLVGDENAVVVYEARRAGKLWEAFEADHAGKTILIPSEAAEVVGMRDAIRRHPRAMELLEGIREKTLYWKIGQRACRGTPDVRTAERVVELKTDRSVRPERFTRSGLRYGYNSALAWYGDGIEASGEPRPEEAYIVAVRSTAPHLVTTFQLTERAIDMGRRQYRAWFEQLMVCEASDDWPEYAQGDVPFDVPDDDFSLIIGGEEVAA
jgi:hypothetical protein